MQEIMQLTSMMMVLQRKNDLCGFINFDCCVTSFASIPIGVLLGKSHIPYSE